MTSLIFFKYSLKVDKSQEFNQIVCCINQIESIQILADRDTFDASLRLFYLSLFPYLKKSLQFFILASEFKCVYLYGLRCWMRFMFRISLKLLLLSGFVFLLSYSLTCK